MRKRTRTHSRREFPRPGRAPGGIGGCPDPGSTPERPVRGNYVLYSVAGG
jgi:hypothetical protein